MIDPFQNLPTVTLADVRAAARARFLTVVGALPLPVRGADVELLYAMAEEHGAIPYSRARAPAPVTPGEGAILERFNKAIEPARETIRETLNAVASRDCNVSRYLTRIERAGNKPSHLHSSFAQPPLPGQDHVWIAAMAEIATQSPEQHRADGWRVRRAMLILAELEPLPGFEIGQAPRRLKVLAALALLTGIMAAKAPKGAPGEPPTMDAAFHLVRVVFDYRHLQGLPVADVSRRSSNMIPTAATRTLLHAAAEALDLTATNAHLNRLARNYLRRLGASDHGLRADAVHVDPENLGFHPVGPLHAKTR